MLILLPPSEGKTAPARGRPLDLASLSLPGLTEARERMLDALVSLSARDDAMTLLGLGPTLLDEAARNLVLREAPAAPAISVYTGVVYEALSFGTLSPAAKRRASARIAIASSLFGLVRPGDRIPAYRLSGDTAVPGLGVVSTYWSRHLSPVADEAAGRFVVDLRSGTYTRFWRPSAPTVTVRVLHEHNGTLKVVSHFNKATKGRIVRAVLEDGGTARSADGFATMLRDLGWKVEPGPQAGVLDVVVDAL